MVSFDEIKDICVHIDPGSSEQISMLFFLAIAIVTCLQFT